MACGNSNEVVAKIYVAAHKLFEQPQDEGYVAIQTGRAFREPLDGMLGDDTGLNISRLSDHFNEISALYWLRHNDDSPYVGLAHYRRFLAPRDIASEVGEHRIASSRDFSEFNEGIDVVVVEPHKFCLPDSTIPETIEAQYIRCHQHFDLSRMRAALREVSPASGEAFEFVMRNTIFVPCSIFVARRKVIEAYVDWLFAVLMRLERMIPYHRYDSYQRRVFGFIAERMFNVWLTENAPTVKIGFRDVVVTE